MSSSGQVKKPSPWGEGGNRRLTDEGKFELTHAKPLISHYVTASPEGEAVNRRNDLTLET